MRYKFNEEQVKIIKETLKDSNRTITELGEFLGVKYKAVAQWFSGKRGVSKAYIILMDMFFDGMLSIRIEEDLLIVEKII